ncbi:hypothetical protein Athai_34710 [Actinocatenispora thailandica]|uniref:Uncharacterized protein n=1 Tax=Actinocatenispora thailandica TaxID=227318 RepID=A0A7R7DQH4_9ACTN|nr:hypothetical protein [Actinocatenispora thailandica]BCJ35968.1 hypothetical protein Athai_34710 [Actinocatenispora thailandica]
MLAFLLQISEWLHSGHIYPFAVFMAVIWLLWLTKAILARQYRPWQADWHTTTSVVIPVVDEEEELFVSVLERIVVQRPTEVIVVINGPRNETLEKVCERVGVVWTWTKTPESATRSISGSAWPGGDRGARRLGHHVDPRHAA